LTVLLLGKGGSTKTVIEPSLLVAQPTENSCRHKGNPLKLSATE